VAEKGRSTRIPRPHPGTARRSERDGRRARRTATPHRHWWRRPIRPGYRPRHRGTRPVSWEVDYQRRLLVADLAVGMAAGGLAYGLRFGAGAAAGSIVWFTALGYGARLLRPLFARPRAWQVLDAVIALVMFAIAASLLVGGL